MDYTPEGIDAIREALSNEVRAPAMMPPANWRIAVMVSHAIALLAELRDRIAEEAANASTDTGK